ncbi:MAG: LCP family protein, partial [Candidatus Pacebacteria bacterium]|nr:LCP family protein [Candidatus Paceibacterota bacterium]
MFKNIKQKLIKKFQKLTKKQRIILLVFLLMLSTTIAASASIAHQHFQKNKQIQENAAIEMKISSQLNSSASHIEDDDRKELNILLIGYGGAGHQGGMLADLIQIAHFDFENKTLAFISIPRDLELSLANAGYRKINNVFSSHMSGTEPILNAGRVTKELLSSLSNLNIKYFIAVDFVGFQRLIGQELGSIEVEVKENFQ